MGCLEEGHILSVDGSERLERRGTLGAGARLPLLGLIHVQILEAREELPDGLEVERVLLDLEPQSVLEQLQTFLHLAQLAAHLAQAAHRIGR